MENTGGDLTRGAVGVEEAIEIDEAYKEKDIIHTSPDQPSSDDAAGKETVHGVSSSGSSSQGESDLEKLDSQIVKVRDAKEGDELYAHLPPHEREIIQRQLDMPPITASFLTLYRYATRNDIIIIVISSICAIIGGAVMPLMTVWMGAAVLTVFSLTVSQIIFGQLAGTFSTFISGTLSLEEFNADISHFTLYFLYLAIGEFVTIYICTVGFIYSGEHISSKIREQYLAAILRQNIAFFDKLGAGEITTRITADTNLVQDGISEKIALTLVALATFFTAFVIGFIKYWKLTLILSSTVFAIVSIMGGGSSFIIKYNKSSLAAYALGGSVAEEVISSIRNATAFNTQEKLARQYDVHLVEAAKWGSKLKMVLGVMVAGMMGVVSHLCLFAIKKHVHTKRS